MNTHVVLPLTPRCTAVFIHLNVSLVFISFCIVSVFTVHAYTVDILIASQALKCFSICKSMLNPVFESCISQINLVEFYNSWTVHVLVCSVDNHEFTTCAVTKLLLQTDIKNVMRFCWTVHFVLKNSIENWVLFVSLCFWLSPFCSSFMSAVSGLQTQRASVMDSSLRTCCLLESHRLRKGQNKPAANTTAHNPPAPPHSHRPATAAQS